MPQPTSANSSSATNAVDAGLRPSAENGSSRTGATIAWAHPDPGLVRAAFEGRRLRSAIVAHARVVHRLVLAHGLTSAAPAGHQRARDELDAVVSRSRTELRAVVRRFVSRIEADGLSKEQAARMLSGLVDSALLDAPPQSSAALRSGILQWGTATFRAGREH